VTGLIDAHVRNKRRILEARGSFSRGRIRRLIDSRWFALTDFAVVSICVALWTAHALAPGQLQINGWPLIIALIPWGIRLAAGRPPFQSTRLDLPIAILLLTAAMGVWTAYDAAMAWGKFWLIVGGILIYFAVAGQPQVNHWILACFLGFVGTLMASFFLLTHDWMLQPAKIEIANNVGLWWMSIRPSVHVQGINPNAAASVMAMTTPFLIVFGLRGWRERRASLVLPAIAVGLLISVALVLTTSRGAWLALSLATGTWLLWGLSGYVARAIRQPRGRIFTIALMLMSFAFIWLAFTYPAGVVGLMESLPGPAGAESRLELARETLDLIGDFPITGGGLGSFPGLYSRYILAVPIFALEHGHNLYLDVALEMGPLGILSIMAMILGSVLLLVGGLLRPEDTNPGSQELRWAGLAALMVISLHGLVDYSHEGAPLLFLLVGMAISLTRGRSGVKPGGNYPSARASTASPRKGRRWWSFVGGAAIVLGSLAYPFNFDKSLLAAWFANGGALEMARVELEGWPSDRGQADNTIAKLETAEAYFVRALKLDDSNRTAHHRLGLVSLQRRDFRVAVQHLEHAYQLDEDHRGIWRSLGSSYLWSGKLGQLSTFDRGTSLDEIYAQNDVFASWLAKERDPYDSLWLAYEALKAGNEGFALALIGEQSIGGDVIAPRILDAAKEASEGLLDNIQAWVGARDSMSIWEAATIATDNGRLADALLANHALQVITGENGVSRLAQFLWEAYDDLDAADGVLRQALEVYPSSRSSSSWYRLLGDLMRADGQYDEAVVAYQKALTEDSEDMWVHIGLGWTYYESGTGLEAAIAEFEQAIAMHPDRADGYLAIGEALERENQNQEAIAWIAQALEQDPECRWCYIAWANISLKAGDLRQALEILDELCLRYPEFARGYLEISWAYRLDEQRQKAIDAIEQAMTLENHPEPWMLVRAATIYEWAGEFDEAISQYRSALEIDPDNEAARGGLDRLKGTRQ